MGELVLSGLLLVVCLFIFSKLEIFIRYLDFIVNNLEKCLYYKQPGAFKYLVFTFEFIGTQGFGALCMVLACDNTINFLVRLASLVIGFITFKLSADYFENAYSELVADVKIKL